MRERGGPPRTLLLLETATASDLGATLQRLIEGSGLKGIAVCRLVLSAGALPYDPAAAAAPCDRRSPALIFAVLPPECHAPPATLLRTLAGWAPAAPVVAVLERAQPREVHALMRAGFSDVLVAPLRACDLLPRLCRAVAAKGRTAGGASAVPLVRRRQPASRRQVARPVATAGPPAGGSGEPETFRQAKAKAVAHFEAAYVSTLLARCAGNVSRAARAAGKHRRAFWELIRKHGIDAREFGGPGKGGAAPQPRTKRSHCQR
jgi:DNA-binding NtrC family response regulator